MQSLRDPARSKRQADSDRRARFSVRSRRRPSRSNPGIFTVPSRPGLSRPAPLVATDVKVEVGGILARGTARQTFVNPDSFWCGIYTFHFPTTRRSTSC